LASLSALGAGALGVAAGTAHAANIDFTPLNDKVGFSNGYGALATIHPQSAGSAYFSLARITSGSVRDVVLRLGNSVLFKGSDAALGQTWSNLPGFAGGFLVLGQRASSGHSGTNGDFYKLFEITGSTLYGELYGWASFYQSVSDTSGPDVTLTGMAYDTTGAMIPAGAGAVPSLPPWT